MDKRREFGYLAEEILKILCKVISGLAANYERVNQITLHKYLLYIMPLM